MLLLDRPSVMSAIVERVIEVEQDRCGIGEDMLRLGVGPGGVLAYLVTRRLMKAAFAGVPPAGW